MPDASPIPYQLLNYFILKSTIVSSFCLLPDNPNIKFSLCLCYVQEQEKVNTGCYPRPL